MWYSDLFENLEKLFSREKSESMASYMKNRFEFLGIQKPERKAAVKSYFAESKKYDFDWNFVKLCWSKPYREAQYIGADYILMNKDRLAAEDLEKLRELITEKSWWDTVDSLDAAVGVLVMKYPELSAEMLKWADSQNIWLRRVAIDFQQKFKEQTDTALLSEIICKNFGSDEFFINKAIGWSLREFSKQNKEWVSEFIAKNSENMSPLSRREASKYL